MKPHDRSCVCKACCDQRANAQREKASSTNATLKGVGVLVMGAAGVLGALWIAGWATDRINPEGAKERYAEFTCKQGAWRHNRDWELPKAVISKSGNTYTVDWGRNWCKVDLTVDPNRNISAGPTRYSWNEKESKR